MDRDGALMHREVTDGILKGFFHVYNTLEYGFLENVYKRAMVVALRRTGLRCDSEVTFPIFYLGENVGDYRADLVVERKVIVEVKTLPKIDKPHASQCYNYLKASRLHVGLVLNFGPKPEFERHFLSNP